MMVFLSDPDVTFVKDFTDLARKLTDFMKLLFYFLGILYVGLQVRLSFFFGDYLGLLTFFSVEVDEVIFLIFAEADPRRNYFDAEAFARGLHRCMKDRLAEARANIQESTSIQGTHIVVIGVLDLLHLFKRRNLLERGQQRRHGALKTGCFCQKGTLTFVISP